MPAPVGCQVIDQTAYPFIAVPVYIVDKYAKTLGGNGMMLYMFLRRLAGKDGGCWPSTDYLCKLTGLSHNTLKKHLSLLEDCGLLKVQERRREDGSRTSNLYVVKDAFNNWQEDSPLSGKAACPKTGETDCRPKTTVDNSLGRSAADGQFALVGEDEEEPPKPERPSKPDTFPAFYAAYGRKRKPKDARKAYERVLRDNKSATPELLLEAAKRYRAAFVATGKSDDYYPYPATWLNSGDWEEWAQTTTHQPSAPLRASGEETRPSGTWTLGIPDEERRWNEMRRKQLEQEGRG